MIVPVVSTLLIMLTLNAFSQEQRVYLKLEDDDPYVSVYNKPGQNWKYCKKNQGGECVDAIGWLDRKANVWVVGPKVKAKTQDPLTNEIKEEEYYPIQFEYTRQVGEKSFTKEKGPIGYIDAAYIDFNEVAPIYSAKSSVKDKSLGCSLKSSSGAQQVDDIKCALELKNLEEASQLLKDRIGFCAGLESDQNKKANLYDNVILSKLRGMSPPKIQDENGHYMTKDQLIEIDSLARTLYGEMASCYKYGLEYPMAVARIAVNRKENQAKHKMYIRGPHENGKPILSKVVTSASQFNIWLRKLNGVKNAPLGMGLCPPRDSGQKMWNGNLPSKHELAIWNHTVKIATEAVLFTKAFKKRTQGLSDIYNYTSGMDKFHNFKKVSVKVEGRDLNIEKCVQAWKEG